MQSNKNDTKFQEINQNQLQDHAFASYSVGKDSHNSASHNNLNIDKCLSISAEHTSNSLSKKRKPNKTMQSSPSSNAHTELSFCKTIKKTPMFILIVKQMKDNFNSLTKFLKNIERILQQTASFKLQVLYIYQKRYPLTRIVEN